jgi:hypothetical protein
MDAGAARGPGGLVGAAWGTAKVMGTVRGMAKVGEASDEGAAKGWAV